MLEPVHTYVYFNLQFSVIYKNGIVHRTKIEIIEKRYCLSNKGWYDVCKGGDMIKGYI